MLKNLNDEPNLNYSEDSTERYANYEYEKENSVEAWMPFGVENSEEDEPTAAYERAEDGKNGKNTFSLPHVGQKPRNNI